MKIKLILSIFLSMLISISIAACSSSDDDTPAEGTLSVTLDNVPSTISKAAGDTAWLLIFDSDADEINAYTSGSAVDGTILKVTPTCTNFYIIVYLSPSSSTWAGPTVDAPPDGIGQCAILKHLSDPSEQWQVFEYVTWQESLLTDSNDYGGIRMAGYSLTVTFNYTGTDNTISSTCPVVGGLLVENFDFEADDSEPLDTWETDSATGSVTLYAGNTTRVWVIAIVNEGNTDDPFVADNTFAFYDGANALQVVQGLEDPTTIDLTQTTSINFTFDDTYTIPAK